MAQLGARLTGGQEAAGSSPVTPTIISKLRNEEFKMKKFLALILAAVVCLSLVACNNDKPSEETQESTTNQEEITRGEVKITADNFDKYFEFIEESFFTKNSAGEINALRHRHYYKLRENYNIDITKSSIKLDYGYSYSTRKVDIDFGVAASEVDGRLEIFASLGILDRSYFVRQNKLDSGMGDDDERSRLAGRHVCTCRENGVCLFVKRLLVFGLRPTIFEVLYVEPRTNAIEESANLLLEDDDKSDGSYADEALEKCTCELQLKDITHDEPCENECQNTPEEVAGSRATQDAVDCKEDECNQQNINNIFYTKHVLTLVCGLMNIWQWPVWRQLRRARGGC